jgi:hypothetical protein
MSYPWLHDTSLHLDLHVLFQDKATSRQMTVLYYEVVDDCRGGNGARRWRLMMRGQGPLLPSFPCGNKGRHHGCFFQFAAGVEETGWISGGRHRGCEGERRPKGGRVHGGQGWPGGLRAAIVG